MSEPDWTLRVFYVSIGAIVGSLVGFFVFKIESHALALSCAIAMLVAVVTMPGGYGKR